MSAHAAVDALSKFLMLGSLLDEIRRRFGAYELVDHWQQGEFHHDLVVRASGAVFVIATNCNGGVKEVLEFESVPDRSALWHARCPDNPEFSGEAPRLLASAKTEHWFEPCELLRADARSEYKSEFRERQCGGGWVPRRDG